MTQRDLAEAFVAKAQEDEVLLTTLLDEPAVSDDIFGFHVQQAIEKYLKAILAVGGVQPRKTHDLSSLFDDVENLGVEVPAELRVQQAWTTFAVRNRYPFLEATPQIDRAKATAGLTGLREWVLVVIDQLA